jgi:CheY-like chemotaxis protein
MSTDLTPPPLILCIANDLAILRYEQAVLERAGYAVLTAISAEQAVKVVTICKCDAVLLDYEMHDLTGYEVASQIKQATPEVAIALLCGSDVPVHALALVDAVIPKREASQQLLPMIAELCGRNNRAPQNHRGSLQPENHQ